MQNRIELVKTDITTLEVDAIVNAANCSLLGGGGVDGAIHLAAGKELLAECRLLGGCPTGEAKITAGYNLPSKFIIHTVGPVWRGGGHNEPSLLANAYLNSLKLANANNLQSIAYSAISCGVYGYPIKQAVKIAIQTVTNWLQQNAIPQKVIFVCFNDDVYAEYEEQLGRLDKETSS